MPPRSKPTPKFHPIILNTGQRSAADTIAEKMTWAMLEEVKSTMDTARSAQRGIGISEIGTDCMKCLSRALSELYHINSPSWKAQVGTFGHAGVEEHLRRKYASSYGSPITTEEEFLRASDTGKMFLHDVDPYAVLHLEEDVVLPVDDGFSIPGHCDLFIEGDGYGIVWDHKFLGPSSLAKKAKGDIGETYDTQLDGYGLGWELKGKTVTHVALGALPRDGELSQAVFVLRPYNRERITARLGLIAKLRVAANAIGWETLIDSQNGEPACWDCPRYEAAENTEFFDSLPIK